MVVNVGLHESGPLLDTLIHVVYIATKWLVHESFMDKSSSCVGCIFPQICLYIGYPELEALHNKTRKYMFFYYSMTSITFV